MENTIENKQRFFAQYYRQSVGKFDCADENINKHLYEVLPASGISYIELKPLSDISDDDAIEVSRMALDMNPNAWNGRCIASCFKPGGSIGNHVTLSYIAVEISDFLRSKGYALPWMGLSIEQLIDYGWVKLKTDE